MDEEHHLEQDPTQFAGSILPPDFKIPDLHEIGSSSEAMAVVNFELEGHIVPVQIFFQRRDNNLEIKIEAIEARGEERSLVFNISASKLPSSEYSNYFGIWNRKVGSNYRGKGLGTRAILTMEQLATKFSQEQGQKFKGFVIETGVAAVARMIADQGWLKKKHLDKFLREDGTNLAYIPKGDEQEIVRLLSDQSVDVFDVPRSDYKQIKFIKSIEN